MVQLINTSLYICYSDLSWSLPINCDLEGFSYLDSPNKLLLDMVYENLQRSHDSELYLSLEDSKLFVELVQQRERDHKMFPIPFPQPPVEPVNGKSNSQLSIKSK